jgi:hypothetical protein
MPRHALAGLAFLAAGTLAAQPAAKITTPKEALGFNLGDDYQVANYTQLEAYWKTLAKESDRMKLVDMGPTEEGRRQWMAVISAPANIKQLDHYKDIARRLARAQNANGDALTDEQAHTLASQGKSIIWIDGGLHASETVGAQQLMEWVYQMVSRTDAETMRFLNDCIFINVQANPDGQELVANWYMRGSEKADAPLKEPQTRSMNNLPRLWAKYIGHDDNRDFYMSNMKETTNMNRAMFVDWYPEIVYNHHQTGPPGTVIFMPPFRDPFNYNFDPLIPVEIEQVGAAMHGRLVAEGKGGSAMRSGQNYSTWWNGGLRTVSYFHNMIGILTEIIGGPNPQNIPLIADKQLPTGDWPLPIAPQEWHYRQSIEYEMTNNRAIADYASRNRENLLYNIYVMGKRSIEKGSKDTWTVTPKRITALEAAADPSGRGGRGGRGAAAAEGPTGDVPGGGGGFGRGGISAELYTKILHDPQYRDPRGYVIPADQPDFANAVEFINALLKTGVDVERATASFTVGPKSYPAGSYIVKTAQAFRPHVLDMFEPQDHPNDFKYPGAAPTPPYDITGWTLALQMGVKFDRILDPFDGPFQKIGYALLPPPAMTVSGPATPAGYLISHEINNSFIAINHLLKANADVYWMKNEVTVDGKTMAPGAIWVTASPAVKTVVEQSAKQYGVPAYALARAPAGEALKLKPIRIGLVDNYGGSMPSGWTKWLFEQYDFPFQVVFPPALDAGDLHAKFDVLVFPDGELRLGSGGFGGRGGGGGGGRGGRGGGGNVPDQYKDEVGSITAERTLPQLRKFVESGGSIVTVGSSTSVAEALGLPVKNFLSEMGPDGRERNLPREKFYIPGSLMRMNIDNTNPLAYGMPKQVDVFYDNNPVFRMEPTAAMQKTQAVGWFQGTQTLASGWAWGQQYLDGGTAVAESTLGEGKVVLLGPEVNFRDQPHATFKLLFNGLYMGSAKAAPLP